MARSRNFRVFDHGDMMAHRGYVLSTNEQRGYGEQEVTGAPKRWGCDVNAENSGCVQEIRKEEGPRTRAGVTHHREVMRIGAEHL